VMAMPWIERAVLSKCYHLVEEVTQALHANSIAPPTKLIKAFLQEDFAAWYIEAAKTRLQPNLGGDPASARGFTAQRVLLNALEVALRLLHPFMPFVTEAVWQRLPRAAGAADSLMISPWPSPACAGGVRDEEAEAWFAKMCSAVTAIRNARAKHSVPTKERVALTFYAQDPGFREALLKELAAVAWFTKADPDKIEVLEFDRRQETPQGVVRTVVSEELEVDMPVAEEEVDVATEVARLGKQLATLSSQLESTEKKITPAFLEKANPTAREKILQKRDDLAQMKAAVEEQLQDMKSKMAAA